MCTNIILKYYDEIYVISTHKVSDGFSTEIRVNNKPININMSGITDPHEIEEMDQLYSDLLEAGTSKNMASVKAALNFESYESST